MEINELHKVSAQEARVQLSDLINKAIYGRLPTLITRQGKPAAVLISYDQWQIFLQQQQPGITSTSSETVNSPEELTDLIEDGEKDELAA